MNASRWKQPSPTTHILRVEATLLCAEPLAIGGGLGVSDAPVLRDADGVPFIPGSTVAGVCRHEVRTRFPQLAHAVEALFGHEDDDSDSGTPSALYFDDCSAVGAAPVRERDHVRLSAHGVVDDRAKYEREVVRAGTRFALRFEWHSPVPFEETPEEQRTLVAAVFAMLEDGTLRFGSRTRRGLGAVTLVATEQRSTLRWRVDEPASFDGMKAWLASLWLEQRPTRDGSVTAFADDVLALGALPAMPGRNALEVSLNLTIDGPILIRDATDEVHVVRTRPGTPHAAASNRKVGAQHLRRQRRTQDGDTVVEPIVAATSWTGALRHRAEAIVRLLDPNPRPVAPAGRREPTHPTRGDTLLDHLFGPPPEGRLGPDGRQAPRFAGALSVRESVIRGTTELRHTRVVIDPWTGGALDQHLFTEDVLFGGTTTLELEVRLPDDDGGDRQRIPTDALRGLVLLLLRDLWQGDLPIGGEVGAGRGVLKGLSASFRWNSRADGNTFETAITDGVLTRDINNAQRWIDALVDHLETQEAP